MKPELVSGKRLQDLWHSFCETQGWKPGAMTIGMRMAFESGARAALEELEIVQVIEISPDEEQHYWLHYPCGRRIGTLVYSKEGKPIKGAVLVRAKEKA